MNRVHRFIRQGNCYSLAHFLLAVSLTCISTSGLGLSEESSVNWSEQVRALVGTSQLGETAQVVKRWMQAYPTDLDARGWNALLLSWTSHWSEAEAEYRELVKLVLDDPDLQLGLADVLNWQERHREALPILDHRCRANPAQSDCHSGVRAPSEPGAQS
jgi:hypothetical protein